jgi:hypothetical protein
VKLTSRSSLLEVTASVAQALSNAGIRAVLTGGACASIYTRGAYQSSDLDFVLQNTISQSSLDAAMAATGFERRGNQYLHPSARFFVEFPAGPLAIGGDFKIQPIEYRVRRAAVFALSPTDSCRDRLAGFYFWNDRQSLRTAVQIAARHSVDLDAIRRWSRDEGFSAAFAEFSTELERARGRRARRRG